MELTVDGWAYKARPPENAHKLRQNLHVKWAWYNEVTALVVQCPVTADPFNMPPFINSRVLSLDGQPCRVYGHQDVTTANGIRHHYVELIVNRDGQEAPPMVTEDVARAEIPVTTPEPAPAPKAPKPRAAKPVPEAQTSLF